MLRDHPLRQAPFLTALLSSFGILALAEYGQAQPPDGPGHSAITWTYVVPFAEAPLEPLQRFLEAVEPFRDGGSRLTIELTEKQFTLIGHPSIMQVVDRSWREIERTLPPPDDRAGDLQTIIMSIPERMPDGSDPARFRNVLVGELNRLDIDIEIAHHRNLMLMRGDEENRYWAMQAARTLTRGERLEEIPPRTKIVVYDVRDLLEDADEASAARRIRVLMDRLRTLVPTVLQIDESPHQFSVQDLNGNLIVTTTEEGHQVVNDELNRIREAIVLPRRLEKRVRELEAELEALRRELADAKEAARSLNRKIESEADDPGD